MRMKSIVTLNQFQKSRERTPWPVARTAGEQYALFLRGATKNKAPTQNYITELKKLDKSAAHAVGRFKLQLRRIKAQPELAAHVKRAELNVQRAQQVSAEVKKQLANAQQGRWIERAVAFQGPGKWSYVPGAMEMTRRLTASAAKRNKLLGTPTLNKYHVRRANTTARAQAALNKLAAGNNMPNKNETRLLQNQLARVQKKQRSQGRQGVFNWEKKLLSYAPLVKQMANFHKQYNAQQRTNPNLNNRSIALMSSLQQATQERDRCREDLKWTRKLLENAQSALQTSVNNMA